MLTRPVLWAVGFALTSFTAPVDRGLMDRGLVDHRVPASRAWQVSGPGAAACARMPDGLVSWWRGDGNALDYTETNPGALQGSVVFGPGIVGQAFQLNGSGFVVVPDDSTLDLVDAFSVEFWFNYTSATTFRGLLAKRMSNNVANFGVNLHQSSTGLGLYYNDPNAAGGDDFRLTRSPFESIRVSAPSAGVFHHFAGTYRQTSTGVELRMYMDGQLIRSLTTPGTLTRTLNAAPVTIGASTAAGADKFLGLLDEVAIYNRVLTGEEIAAIHAAASAGKCTVVPFASFTITRARIGQTEGAVQDQLEITGQFALGPSSDGIALPGEQVVISLGDLTWTLPGGSFVRTDENDGYQFHTTAPGLKQLVIRDNGNFRVRASELDLGVVEAGTPLVFTLRIGNDEGSASVASAERGRIRELRLR